MKWIASNNREILLQTYRNSFSNQSRQFILNYGKAGSGKTQEANYFVTDNPIPETASGQQVISILVNTSEHSSEACPDIISSIWAKLAPLTEIIAANIDFIGEEKMRTILQQRMGSFEFSKAIVKLCSHKQGKDSQLLSRYLFSGLENEELQFFKISREINTWSNQVRFLSGLMIAICLSERPKRIFLWIDNAESSIFYLAKVQRNFNYLLRDFSEMAMGFLTIFLNYSLFTNNQKHIDALIGNILLSTVTQRICFTA